jgi:hypothetical protein
MDWIEALTGWDPDHGDGSLEAVIFVAILLVLVVATGIIFRRAAYLGGGH